MRHSKIEQYIIDHSIDAYFKQLEVFTSNILYEGEDRLDITVKSGIREFAPTWDLVNDYRTERITQNDFISQYIRMLNVSYIENREAWDSLLAKARVTLVCYCDPDVFCHRQILAEYLQQRFKARYTGEIVGDYVVF